jgi:soluble lytic murein transglycosylase
MTRDYRPIVPPTGESESEVPQTDESETLVARTTTPQTDTRRNRGYWISGPVVRASQADAPSVEAPSVEASRTGERASAGPSSVSLPDETYGAGAPRVHKRRTHKYRLLRLGVVSVVLVGVVTAIVLITTGRTVVPVISQTIYPIHYKDDIARVAEAYDQDPYLVAAVVKTESGYDPEAVSPAGAVGLMQLMPDTAAWIIELDIWQGDENPALTDPADNLELGACYLSYLGDIYGEGTRSALAAYNAGPNAVGEWIEAAGGQDSFDLTDIPYAETRNFVQRVERYVSLYMRIHPDAFSAAGASGKTGAPIGALTLSRAGMRAWVDLAP